MNASFPPTAGSAIASAEHPLHGMLKGRVILQVVPDLDLASGVEDDVLDVAGALVAVGARAIIAGPAGALVGELQARGAEWLHLPTDDAGISRTLANVRRLRNIVRTERVALVHARSRAPAWSAWLATHGPFNRNRGVPLVTTYSGPYSEQGRLSRAYNGIMAKGEAVVASSQFAATLLARRHPAAAERICVVPRGVAPEEFDPESVPLLRVARQRHAWDARAEERIVLLPGRLTPWKGHLVLIEAFRRLVVRLDELGAAPVRLVMAGEAKPGAHYLQHLARRLEAVGLAEQAVVTEAPEHWPAALMAADVVAMPSTEPEAFARAALEVLALGRPLVVSDHGALREVVRVPPEAATGWRVPPGDPAELARALHQALEQSTEEREAMARRARRDVELRFSRRHEVAATLSAYARAVTGTAPAGVPAVARIQILDG
jgi:glycosyltransferase involved in cell wall biosynthesis